VTVHDRLRATTTEIDKIMYPVSPLALPPLHAPARRGLRIPRTVPSLLVPFAAAAAVIALTVSLVSVRALPGMNRPGASPSAAVGGNSATAGIPKYAVLLVQDRSHQRRDAVLADTRTGKALGTVVPPSGYTFSGVAAAENGKFFVIDAASLLLKPHQDLKSIWFELTPAGVLRLNRLKVPGHGLNTQVGGFAVSPDGSTLAAMYVTAGQVSSQLTLATYSLATGRQLHAWTGAFRWSVMSGGGLDELVRLSWLDDGRTLAFEAHSLPTTMSVYLLDTARPGHALFSASRLVFTLSGNADTAWAPLPLLTPDGRTVWAALLKQPVRIAAYSTATGKPRYIVDLPPGIGSAGILWAGSATRAIVATYAKSSAGIAAGVVTPGKFTPLRLPFTGSSRSVFGDYAAIAF
jgi:hypothetical protein